MFRAKIAAGCPRESSRETHRIAEKVTPDGKVKLLDFGRAKAIEGEPSGSGACPRLAWSTRPSQQRRNREIQAIEPFRPSWGLSRV